MRFLSVEDVHLLHRRSIEGFGGTLGVRDSNGLESAVFHPQNVAIYGGGDLFDVAAAYAFHIAEGQCFLDGNKRTAIASALNFLANNGVFVKKDTDRLHKLMIGIAEKRYSKRDLAGYFRQCNTQK
jgi:death-on-curing protein